MACQLIFNLKCMETKNSTKADLLVSLNKVLSEEFSMQELEPRLETNPLFLSGDLSFGMDPSVESCFTCDLCFTCNEFLNK